MNESTMQDQLAAHADQLIGIGAPMETELSGESEQQLADLMHLATQVKDALAPKRMPQATRARLGSALTYAVSVRDEGRVRIASDRSPAQMILGAATVALAGGILYLARNYLQGRSQSTGQISS
jgi:hypothetical protein